MDYNLQNPQEIATLLKAKWDLGIAGGVVITNPIPKESSLDFNLMTDAIDKAILEQNKLGIKGKESTPFLLAKVKELTRGRSLISNIELVRNNVILAAKIAVAYVKTYH